MARMDREKGARALAQWAMKHHRRAFASSIAESYGITERTLWNWKSALETDDELSALYEKRLNEILNRDWAISLEGALGDGIEKLRELINATSSLSEATEAVKMLAEIQLTKEVLSPNAPNPKPHTDVPSTGATPQTHTAN